MPGQAKQHSDWRIHGWRLLGWLVVVLAIGVFFRVVGPRNILGGTLAASLHDRVLLPVVLKWIYASVWLFPCIGLLSLLLVLRPEGRWFRTVVMVLAGSFCLWAVIYEMWHNALTSTAVVAAVLLYVIGRYLWVPCTSAVRGIARRIYFSMRRYALAEKEQGGSYGAIRIYYDAIRAFSLPSQHSSGPTPRLWDRSARPVDPADAGLLGEVAGAAWLVGALFFLPLVALAAFLLRQDHRFWRWLLARPAGWYREKDFTGMLPLWIRVGRFLVHRKIPASLEFEWLRNLLDNLVTAARIQLHKNQGDRLTWLTAYRNLADAIGARVEYAIFDLDATPRKSRHLADAADDFDELSRIALVRQISVANVDHGDSQAQGRWKELTPYRVASIQKALLLREHARGNGQTDDPQQRLQGLVAAADRRGADDANVQNMVLTMSYCQLALLGELDLPKPEATVFALLGRVGTMAQASPSSRRALAWKAIELACDVGEFRLAMDLLALNWTSARPSPSKLPTDQKPDGTRGPARWAEPQGQESPSELPTDQKPDPLGPSERDRRLAGQLEGNLLWWLARGVADEDTQLDGLRRAAMAFLQGNCYEREQLKKEVAQVVAQGDLR
jgi:hypothetical protein